MKVLTELGFTSSNTHFAQSVCPDEINHEEGDITVLFSRSLGEVFHLGGLAGIPFTGKTGFHAFSHHIPDDGHIFILYAPHIGLSSNMEFGKYSRDGQCIDGSACGAAIGALNYCIACDLNQHNQSLNTTQFLLDNPLDYQMNYIISEIDKKKNDILSYPEGNDRQTALAHAMYEIGLEFLNGIIPDDVKDTQGKSGCNIIILAGVQINMPRPMPDFFQPILFEQRKHGQPPVDLMTQTFGTPIVQDILTSRRRYSLSFSSSSSPSPDGEEVQKQPQQQQE